MANEKIHYKVEIGDGSKVLYCDSYMKVQSCRVRVALENRARKRKTRTRTIKFRISVREYYDKRRQYLTLLQVCYDTMAKAQRLGRCAKRDRLFERYALAYDKANSIWEEYPEVWQGEV